MTNLRTFVVGETMGSKGAKREAELLFIHDFTNLTKILNIPKSMVLNLDQTLVKHVRCGKTTLVKQNTSSVPVSGVSDK